MRIAAYCPPGLPQSSRVYANNVIGEIGKAGHHVENFSARPLPQQVDVYWQPSTGRNGPDEILAQAGAPAAVTFHGAANLSMPLPLCFGAGVRNIWNGWLSRLRTRREWRLRRHVCSRVIAVSAYAKKEAGTFLKIPLSLIEPIYHGVDHQTFYPAGDAGLHGESYLLHISSYQPKKNLDRIIAAYNRIKDASKPRLKIIAPGYPRANNDAGIELIKKPLDHPHIAHLYRHAIGFIFPSLHETFGMPIIEAMACGCPVITSNHPACVEIAGDAAVAVDPYSLGALEAAMGSLATDPLLRQSLRVKGINRAGQFSWEKCAKEHLNLFQQMKEKN